MLVTSRNGLGITVNEMQRSINGMGDHAPEGNNTIIPYGHWQPFDPSAITRGYAGLGDVPNDFEASVDLQYIPVRQGWYYGTPVDGGSYPTMQPAPSRGALGDAAADAAQVQLAKSARVQTVLQIISTAAIATMALLTVVRVIKTAKTNGRLFGDDEDTW